MYFKRFYDEPLAQASYLIACQAAGTAIVIDPARVIAPYLETAAQEGFRIVAVTETHIHADFVSGLRELVAATGATGYLSAAGPPEWQYGFGKDAGMRLLADRESIQLGKIVITAVHTPGHTPEHLSFLVTDGAAADEPMGLCSGDFVFVGDVGRPDLLEKAAHVANTAEAGARQLYRSLGWFRNLPDHLQVWPGHGAGSACGKGLGAMPQSTVGYERRFNWAFGPETEDEFVRMVLAGQPEPPRYFGRMKQVNRDGPPVLGRLPEPGRLAEGELLELLAASATVVDARPAAQFAAGHLPGSISIPLNRSFTTYAGSLLPYDRPLHFILEDASPAAVSALVRGLVSIGFDRIAGVADGLALRHAGRPLEPLRELSVADYAGGQPAGAVVVDVRNRSEWDDGHLPGAVLIPLPELPERLGEIPRDREVVFQCQTGGRSAIAASVLQAGGHRKVVNLTGGYAAWVGQGGAIER
ncbi:MAG: rhodanese-like domain-containing protein [Gemmatimonadales bacterium]